jgi:ketosteroid isomerase-like protein
MDRNPASPLPSALCALLLLPACAFGPAIPVLLGDPDADGVRLQIEAAWRAHIAAAQRQDLDGVMAIYADDCVYEALGSPVVDGKQALRAMEQRGIETGRVVSAAHRVESLRVSGDIALEMGTVAGEVAPGGQPPQRVVYHYIAHWRFDDGPGWRIARLCGYVDVRPR